MEAYPEEMHGYLTVRRPDSGSGAVWMYSGEPVFDRFCAALLSLRVGLPRRGAIFVDPHAETSYLFHLDPMSVARRDGERPETVQTRLIGLRQESDGAISPCPLEHLLLLRSSGNIAPGSVRLARLARGLTKKAKEWLKDNTLARMAQACRTHIEEGLPERLRRVGRGYDHKIAELMATRQQVCGEARRDDPRAQAELAVVKVEQSRLVTQKNCGLALLEAEPSLIELVETAMLVHALVVPTDHPEERQRHDTEVETITMDITRAHERAASATVRDVSRPVLARREGLGDWPGFDLRSVRPSVADGPAAERAIEVKGRARSGTVEVSENEWPAACNLRDRYWLHVFNCATPRPRLAKGRDPFGNLIAKNRASATIPYRAILATSEEDGTC